jgi:hypothetical protein
MARLQPSPLHTFILSNKNEINKISHLLLDFSYFFHFLKKTCLLIEKDFFFQKHLFFNSSLFIKIEDNGFVQLIE